MTERQDDAAFHSALTDYERFIVMCYGVANPRANFKAYRDTGRKFLRIMTESYGSRSSHSFVVMEDTKKWKRGDILKSASWKAPAQNFIRGNIFDPPSYNNRVGWTGCK